MTDDRMSSEEWDRTLNSMDRAKRAKDVGPSAIDPSEEQLRMFEAAAKMEEARAAQEEAKTAREKMKRGFGPDSSAGPRQLLGRSLDGVSMHAIEWLWIGWIPKGYITLVAGETGAGKSTVIADIAARVTTGAPWPGEYDCPNAWRSPERVLWLGSEDSIEEMTVPRLPARQRSCCPRPCLRLRRRRRKSASSSMRLHRSANRLHRCSMLSLRVPSRRTWVGSSSIRSRRFRTCGRPRNWRRGSRLSKRRGSGECKRRKLQKVRKGRRCDPRKPNGDHRGRRQSDE